MTQAEDTHVLRLRDIAAWQFPQLAEDGRPIVAAIPSLQRGAVWKPQQVELLWDSILRGFPVGSLVVSPVLVGQEPRSGRHGPGWSKDRITHHLLDGQQRCNAIALGFQDHLADAEADPDSTLWLDLAPQAHFAPNSSRAFLVRLCSSAHPWGYGTQDPPDACILKAHQIREALRDDYRLPLQPQDLNYQRPRPKDTWPHKAGVPVPLSWLLQCAAESQSEGVLWLALQARLERHFMISALDERHWASKAHRFLQQADPAALQDLAEALHAVASARIVALAVSPRALSRSTRQEDASDAAAPEAGQRIANVEHLFQRLNAGGTELRGDELLYSMIKAYWPGIETTIDALPSRPPATQVALLGTRVALSDAGEGGPRGALSVTQLRAMAHPAQTRKPELHARERQRIEDMFDLHRACAGDPAHIARILKVVDGWLLYDAQHNPWGLPPALRSQMAEKCPEVFFFLMLVAREALSQPDDLQPGETVRRRLVGLASAIHWFGLDTPAAVRELWKMGSPRDWLQPRTFEGALARLKNLGEARSGVAPLLSPAQLAEVIEAPSAQTLKDWDWWHTLIASPTADQKEQGERQARYWPLLKKLPYCQPLLMYAQRAWMARRFAYDPHVNAFWDEHNRPWDFDHILPQSYFTDKRGTEYMAVCQRWGHTIGNLHIVRFEENRSRQDRAASESIACDHLEVAWLRDGEGRDLRPAFSLDHGDVRGNGRDRPMDEQRDRVLGFVHAARTRLLRVYSEWYAQLDIEVML